MERKEVRQARLNHVVAPHEVVAELENREEPSAAAAKGHAASMADGSSSTDRPYQRVPAYSVDNSVRTARPTFNHGIPSTPSDRSWAFRSEVVTSPLRMRYALIGSSAERLDDLFGYRSVARRDPDAVLGGPVDLVHVERVCERFVSGNSGGED